MSTSEMEVTKRLAEWVCESEFSSVPEDVGHEAARTLLNWMGCAVGGSRHESVDIALRALGPFMGQPQASVLGRAEKVDVLHAALLNGIGSHVFDFDDTHLQTIIHPAGPVASALVPLAEHRPVSGRDFLHALILGVEVECRIGNAVYPD
ncbi:MAG: MmgE/PrpD family protein, partial [Deltaproteobacteria bacterium]|nr:MmgE/PrpD family protein [Deltaproteobacteria bacterium]